MLVQRATGSQERSEGAGSQVRPSFACSSGAPKSGLFIRGGSLPLGIAQKLHTPVHSGRSHHCDRRPSAQELQGRNLWRVFTLPNGFCAECSPDDSLLRWLRDVPSQSTLCRRPEAEPCVPGKDTSQRGWTQPGSFRLRRRRRACLVSERGLASPDAVDLKAKEWSWPRPHAPDRLATLLLGLARDKAARKFGFDEFNFPEPGEKKAQRHDRRARGKKEEEVVAAAADDATAGGAAADGAAAGGAAAGGAAADGAAAAGAAADGAATDGAAADGAATGAAAAAAGGERRGSSGAAGGE